MATKVAGELKDSILSKLFEIERQIRQKGGYGFNPTLLNGFLQRGVEGKFGIGDFKITTIPFNSNFIGEGWKAEDPEKKFISTEVDLAQAGYVSCLKEGETSIKGEEHLRRLKEGGYKPYGANLFLALWEDWKENKKNCLLERAYRAGIIKNYIDFPDDIFLFLVGGGRSVLYLSRYDDGRWNWCARWLGNDWDARHVSVVSPQVCS